MRKIEGNVGQKNKKVIFLGVMSFLLIAAMILIRGIVRKSEAPALTEKNVDIRLTNMYGETLSDKYTNGYWTLGSEEEVLVWMDLPNDIDQLDGRLESTFPYEVKAGETGQIDVKLTSDENGTIYTGTLNFVAADDLTLESGVEHKAHSNSGDVTFWNDECYEMSCLTDILDAGKKTYMHYSLYTSSKNVPIIFNGGYSSVGYDMDYDIRAIGEFGNNTYERVHGGTVNEKVIANQLPTEPSPSEIAGMSEDL